MNDIDKPARMTLRLKKKSPAAKNAKPSSFEHLKAVCDKATVISNTEPARVNRHVKNNKKFLQKKRSKSFRARQKLRHGKYRKKCLNFLINEWPLLFNHEQVLPLAIGIENDMFTSLIQKKIQNPDSENLLAKSHDEIRSFLHQSLGYYTHRPAYLLAMAQQGSCRYDLSGTIKDDISEEHRLGAKRKLLAQKVSAMDALELEKYYLILNNA
jgi:hypothetical protein